MDFNKENIDDIMKTYCHSIIFLDHLIFLVKQGIPYEDWPSEFKIAGLNDELTNQKNVGK